MLYCSGQEIEVEGHVPAGNKRRCPQKADEIHEYIFDVRCARHRLVRYAGELRNVRRDRAARINVRRKPINLVVVNKADGGQLDDLASFGVQPRRFKVEHNIFAQVFGALERYGVECGRTHGGLLFPWRIRQKYAGLARRLTIYELCKKPNNQKLVINILTITNSGFMLNLSLR